MMEVLYFQLLHQALEMRLSVGILRVKEGLDMTGFGVVKKHYDKNTTTGGYDK